MHDSVQMRFRKRLGFARGQSTEVIEFLHFGGAAVAEHRDQLIDMVGEDVFRVFVSIPTNPQ